MVIRRLADGGFRSHGGSKKKDCLFHGKSQSKVGNPIKMDGFLLKSYELLWGTPMISETTKFFDFMVPKRARR